MFVYSWGLVLFKSSTGCSKSKKDMGPSEDKEGPASGAFELRSEG